jgi:Popeye protein conserved region
MIGPEYFLHASNITRVFSFSATDVLWLRILAMLASLIGLPYFYLQTTVLWEPIVWAVLFMTINAYHVWRLWMERRPVELSSDEARLYDLTFFPLSPRQFVELARLGRWTDQKTGDVLLRPNEPIGELAVPLTESVDAKVAGRHFGRFPAGAIIGASALFDPRLPQLEATAGESCRVLWLPISAMKERAQRDSQLARTIDRVAREDLARKLAHLAQSLQSGWDERRTGA